MVKIINKLMDYFLVMKRLKVFLFIILMSLFLLVIYSIRMLYTSELCFSDIIAPFMIGISALLASSVAMINLRTNYIDRVVNETKEHISEINYLIMSLNMIQNKLSVYKKIVYNEQKVDLEQLLLYIKIFLKYEEFFKNKILIYYSSYYNKKNIFTVLNNIENCLLFISMYNNEVLKFKEKPNNYGLNFLPKKEYIKKHIDYLIENTQDLSNALYEYNQIITDKQYNIS